MSTRPSPESGATRSLTGPSTPARRVAHPWQRTRLKAFLLGPGWRASIVAALVLGGLGGLAPVAILGEPGLGAGGALTRGWLAAGVMGPVWIPPLVATTICTERELGASALRVVSGVRGSRLRVRRWAEAGIAVAAAMIGAAGMGAIGGTLATLFAPGQWSLGLAGAGSPQEVASASAVAGTTAVFAAGVSEICQRRHLAVAVLGGSLAATVALLAVLYFAPVLSPLQVASPWIGVWPLRASTARSPHVASAIDPWLAALATALWVLTVLGTALAPRPSEHPPRRDGDHP